MNHDEIDVLQNRIDYILASQGFAVNTLLVANGWKNYFKAHSKSFSFSSIFFPRETRKQVALLYTFCRLTDDLVDYKGTLQKSNDSLHTVRLLELWKITCKKAYEQKNQPFVVLKLLTADMRQHHVPFSYMDDLIKGVEMDLTIKSYQSMKDFTLYCYRVASVVGLWMTRLSGVHDEKVLNKAKEMGYAMQTTNILRDVGEDLQLGRVYLPQTLLKKYDLSVQDLPSLDFTHADSDKVMRYQQLVDELCKQADQWYDSAIPSIINLPPHFQKAVITATFIYRHIHHLVQKNGANNITKRSKTSTLQKIFLTIKAFQMLKTLKQRQNKNNR